MLCDPRIWSWPEMLPSLFPATRVLCSIGALPAKIALLAWLSWPMTGPLPVPTVAPSEFATAAAPAPVARLFVSVPPMLTRCWATDASV